MRSWLGAACGMMVVVAAMAGVAHLARRADRAAGNAERVRDLEAEVTALRLDLAGAYMEDEALRTRVAELMIGEALRRPFDLEMARHLKRCRARMLDVRAAIDALVAAWPRETRALPPRIADWPDWPEVGEFRGSPMRKSLKRDLAGPAPAIDP